jgi:lipooligosaccharide transport system permease protein
MPSVSRAAAHVWQRNRDVYMNIWRSEIVWPVVDPLITLLALGLGLGEFVELDVEGDYIDFIAPGLLAVFPMWFAAGETGWGSFFRMENQRTFDAIIATPAGVDDVTTGEIMWASTRAFISVAYIWVLIVVLGLSQSPLVVLVLPIAVLPGLMFGAISLCYTAVTRSISQLNYFFAAYITPQFWLSGAFFPLDSMPEWLQVVAWFTPSYHVVEVYRSLTTGDVGPGFAVNIVWMVVVTGVAYVFAANLMRRRLIR